MLRKLKHVIFGKPPVEKLHEYFGKMLFMGEDTPADDEYWECELEVDGCKQSVGVLISAGIGGPSPDQVQFCKKIISNLDALFQRCWPVFEPDFEQWTGKIFSGQWRDDFELVGVGIPKNADPEGNWHVCYFVHCANHYFTAQFENGEPKANEIDG